MLCGFRRVSFVIALTFASLSYAQENETKADLLAELSQLESGSSSRIPVLVKLVKACWRACANEAEGYGFEALTLLEKWPDLEQETNLLIYFPRIFQQDGQHNKAQVLIDRGLLAATQLGDKRKIASMQFNQAMVYSDLDKIILAEAAYMQLYKTYKALGNSSGMGSSLNNLGMINRRLHNYGKALEQYQEALALYEKDQVVHLAANTLSNIGQVYFYLADYRLAEESILRGLNMISIEQYPGIYVAITTRLADVYIETQRYEEADALLTRLLEMSAQFRVRLSDPALYARLVKNALAQNNLVQAKHYYQLGVESAVNRKTGHQYDPLVDAAANIFIAEEKFNDAVELLYPFVSVIENGDSSDTLLNMLNRLIEIKQSQGEWQDSSKLLQLYNQRYAEQVERNTASRLEQFNTLYQANERERQIAELEKENNAKSLQVLTERNAREQVIFISGAVAMILFLAIYVGMQKRKLLVMRTQLLQADAQKKRQLFSDISHELRTPLSVLKLQIEGLEYNLYDDPKETYGQLHVKLASINHLISDISKLAQADAGELRLAFEYVNVREFFTQWCEQSQPLVEKEGLEFISHLDIPENLECVMDPERIKQVLNNLLSNSCRYTDSPGSVELKVRVHNACLEWLVRDSSPGLESSQLPLIFDRLYRADVSRSRKYGGSGLGLAICKSFIEGHFGTVSAEKSKMGGVCIKVSIPLNAGQLNHD